MEQKNNKTEWLHVRLSKDEHDQISREFAKTTLRKLSEYTRRKLLDKPVIGTYRNQSMDDALVEIVKLRGELNALGNNLNQAVKKLHTYDTTALLEGWISDFEQTKISLENCIGQLAVSMDKLADSWLQ